MSKVHLKYDSTAPLTDNLIVKYNTGGDLTNSIISDDGSSVTIAGTIGIGTASPNSDSILDLTSTTQGLLIPRMTTVQRDAMGGSPVVLEESLKIYNTTTQGYEYWTGSAWVRMTTGDGENVANANLTFDANRFTSLNDKWWKTDLNTGGYVNFSSNNIDTDETMFLLDNYNNDIFNVNNAGEISIGDVGSTINGRAGQITIGNNPNKAHFNLQEGSGSLPELILPECVGNFTADQAIAAVNSAPFK